MAKEKKLKPDHPKQNWGERIKRHPYYIVLGLLLSILTILGYLSGAFGKILTLHDNINKITAIEKKITDLEPYKAEQKVTQENVRHLEKKLDSLEERFYESLTKKTFEIKFKIAMDKVEEFHRNWGLKRVPTGEFLLMDPMDRDYSEAKGTVNNLKDEYQQFLKKNPEKLEEIDVTIKALETYYGKLKEETGFYLKEAGIKKEE